MKILPFSPVSKDYLANCKCDGGTKRHTITSVDQPCKSYMNSF